MVWKDWILFEKASNQLIYSTYTHAHTYIIEYKVLKGKI